MLLPDQSLTAIGLELLLPGVAIWLTTTVQDIRNYGRTKPKYRASSRFLLPVLMGQFAVICYVVAGVWVLTAGAGGLYWLAPAVLISFLKAALDAWVLLVEINR